MTIDQHRAPDTDPLSVPRQGLVGQELLGPDNGYDHMQAVGVDTPLSALSQRMQKELGLVAKTEVQAGDRTFYLSSVLDSAGEYPMAVMYTEAEIEGTQMIVPRMLYKSNSDGGWRVGFGIEGGGRFKKEARAGGHYTQETKLHPDILATIETLPVDSDPGGAITAGLRGAFSIGMAPDLGATHTILRPARPTGVVTAVMGDQFTGPQEINYFKSGTVDERLAPLRSLSAGMLNEVWTREVCDERGFDTMTEYVQSLDGVFQSIPQLLPDFSARPIKVTEREHTLLGTIITEDYPAVLAGRPIVWSMARDYADRIWVDNVFLADTAITSYGTYAEVVDMGIVTSKPLDYKNQTTGLIPDSERQDRADGYAYITPLLAQLLPVDDYIFNRALKAKQKR